MLLTQQRITEYKQLFNSCVIRTERFAEVDQTINLIMAGRQRYEVVQAKINVPWYFTGIIHCLEGSLNFKTHLHNGDSLNDKTKNVPRGRPTGKPPFEWEDSAIDALKLQALDVWTDWNIAGMLFQFERYNGFGYRRHRINSPYLWSFSTHYEKGKFVKDNTFSENASSKQCGAAVLLRRMSEKQMIVTGEIDSVSQIKSLGGKVRFAPKKFNEHVLDLQRLLNSVGIPLRI